MLLCILAIPTPAYAYGDPSGGALFQILGPILAILWGAWMIFANGVSRRFSNLLHKLRGSKGSDAADGSPEAGSAEVRSPEDVG